MSIAFGSAETLFPDGQWPDLIVVAPLVTCECLELLNIAMSKMVINGLLNFSGQCEAS